MPLNDAANTLLRDFHAGKPGVFAFAKALNQLALDYTPESLQRIDRLLMQMHQQLKPGADFLDAEDRQNFLALLAYYVGTTIARFSLQQVCWLQGEELSSFFSAEELKGVPSGLPGRICGVFFRGDKVQALIFPLSTLLARLFHGDEDSSVAAAAENLLGRALDVVKLIPPSAPVTTPANLPKAIAEALVKLGEHAGAHFAAACRIDLASGAVCAPQVAQLGADGRRLITSMQFMESADDAFASARAKLEDAGHGVQGATFIYDAHINLPAFRTDCLMLEAHWHAPEIRLTLALPYRAAQQADGFALYTPRLINSSLPSGCEALLASALFAGMDSFNPPGLWAASHVDEDSPENRAARRAEQQAAGEQPPPAAWRESAPDDLQHINIAECIASLPAEEKDYPLIAQEGWLAGSRLQFLLDGMPRLLGEGRVVWGHLVRANTSIFELGSELGLPGDVVYDPQGETSPEVLGEIAHTLFAARLELPALRAAAPAQAALCRVAEHLADDYSCARALPVPAEVAGRTGLQLSSTYFSRHHLPGRYLCASYFPLLIHDALPGVTMALPSRWWPASLLAACAEVEQQRVANRRLQAWQRLAHTPTDEEKQYLAARHKAIDDYILRGISDEQIAQKVGWLSDFNASTQPPPCAWEWGLGSELISLGECQLRDVEKDRARGEGLNVQQARLAFASRYTGQMITLHTRLLAEARGGTDDEEMSLDFLPEEIQFAALGLIAGAEQPALHMARLLCAAWEFPQIYFDLERPEVTVVFALFAQHLGISLPPLPRKRPLPKLDALLVDQAWSQLDADALCPLLEAACVEHTQEAPDGPFLGLPIALALILKLRSLRGLRNPQLGHPLLKVPLEPWAAPVDLDACLDKRLRALRQRLVQEGYDEQAIAQALLAKQPLQVAARYARPAPGGTAGLAMRYTPQQDEVDQEAQFPKSELISLVAALLATIGSVKLIPFFANTPAIMTVLMLLAVVLGLVSLLFAAGVYKKLRRRGE